MIKSRKNGIEHVTTLPDTPRHSPTLPDKKVERKAGFSLLFGVVSVIV